MKALGGEENFINNGECLSYSIIDFWKWGFSELDDNTIRGTFAEFIVKTALDEEMVDCNLYTRGWAEYDLDGPIIPALNRNARIEVKCTGLVQSWGMKHPERASFSIAPAKKLDLVKLDYLEDAPRQRNNDLYVFCVYKASDLSENVLDMSLWEFYVIPTQMIENDPSLFKQKSLSLNRLKSISCPVTYSELYGTIKNICGEITLDKMHLFYSDGSITEGSALS